MTMLSNYRISENIQEIVHILKKTELSDETFIWLNDEGERTKIHVDGLDVNEEFYMFTMSFRRESMKNLKPNKMCYLKLAYGGTVFKVNVVHIGNNVATCQIPRQIYTIEKRAKERTTVNLSDNYQVTFSFSSDVISSTRQEFTFRLRDFSKRGAAIVIGDDQYDLMKSNKNKDIFLTKIGKSKLPSALLTSIKYAKKMKFRYNGTLRTGFRVGFAFDEELSDETFDLFFTSF